MTHTDRRWSGSHGYTFTLRTWECCGMRWQLLLSSRFHSRDKWAPQCPRCGDIACMSTVNPMRLEAMWLIQRALGIRRGDVAAFIVMWLDRIVLNRPEPH